MATAEEPVQMRDPQMASSRSTEREPRTTEKEPPLTVGVDGAPADSAEGDFDTARVLTLAGAHLVVDNYTSFLAPMLPLLIARLHIPLTLAGGLGTVQRAAALAQPVLGLWADRADTRFFVIVAPMVSGLSLSLLGVAPNYLTVALLLFIGGLSHAAFHPAGAASVTRASGRTWGKGTSVYLFGGEMGRAIGPILIVLIVIWFGQEQSYFAASLGLVCSAILYMRLGKGERLRKSTGISLASAWQGLKEQRRAFLMLCGIALFRSTAIQSIATFYPTFLTQKGDDLLFAGIALSAYQLAGAFGALVGGTLSDRFGRKRMMLLSQLVAGPVMYVGLAWMTGVTSVAVVAVTGGILFFASPVQLTLAQELLPGSRSMAAGIVMLLSFEGTVIATLVVGAVADWIGLASALQWAVLASMLSIPFTLALPETQRRRPEASASG